MKNVGWSAAVLIFLSAGSLLAHHSLAQFDTTTAVRVKGVLVRFEQVNPHSLLIVDAKRPDGQIQRWTVEGPGIFQLRRMGMDIGQERFKVGDVIEACGYILKKDVDAGSGGVSSYKAAGRFMDGEEVVLRNGEKLRWSDYGHHLCLGADYADFHSK